MQISIIIVNYHSEAAISALIRSLEKLVRGQSELKIIIVDSSKTFSKELLDGVLFHTELIPLTNNLGFAAACNIGIRKAITKRAEFIWLLNPDMLVEENSLTFLLQTANENPNAFVGSLVLYDASKTKGETTQEEKIWGAGGFISGDFNVCMNLTGEARTQAPTSLFVCDYIPGCSIFFRAITIQSHSLMPEDYFLYFEETEWCHRLNKAGVEMLIDPRSIVYHDTAADKMQHSLRVYFYNRSETLFKLKLLPLQNRLQLLGLKLQQAFSVLKNRLISKESKKDLVQQAHLASAIDAFIIALTPRQIKSRVSRALSRKALRTFK